MMATSFDMVLFDTACMEMEDNEASTSGMQEVVVCARDTDTLPTYCVQNGSSRVSLTSLPVDVCRICHCEGEPGSAPLISPCACAGTLRYVHQSCLQQWIKSANTKSCELCRLNFQMTTTVKPFRKCMHCSGGLYICGQQWQKLEMTKVERRKICCSVTFHAIAITCVVWSLYVLIDRTAEEIRAGVLEWPFWTKLIVVAIGFAGGLVFMYVQCKMYVQLCRRWRAYNRVIYVQDCTTTRAAHRGSGSARKLTASDGMRAMVTSKFDHVQSSVIVPHETVELQLL